jgi:phospholipid N-methyltransferase
MKTSGSIAPSSKYLIRKCLKYIDFETANVILEFGVGDGVITEEILKKINPNCKVIAIEINENLFDYTQKKFQQHPNLDLVLGSAFDFDQILKDKGVDKIDYVVSSLPLSLFENGEIKDLFEKVPNYLAEDGAFIQYQYTLGKYPYLKKIFEKVSIDFTLMNAPPALIFTCFIS